MEAVLLSSSDEHDVKSVKIAIINAIKSLCKVVITVRF